MELDLLRLQAHKLQTELDQLQGIHNCETMKKKRVIADSETIHQFCLIEPRKKNSGFVWQEIAKRQLNERLRAQTANRELREQLQAEYSLGRQMMILLHRNAKLTTLKNPNKKRNLLHDNEAVFKDQLAQAEDSLLEMENILLQPVFQDPQSYYLDTFLKKCGDQEFFIMESNVTLPFAPQVAANAVWKVMSTDKIKDHCYDHCFIHQSDTLLSQAFGIHFTTDASDADFRGNYTLCRFQDTNRIVIVWVALYIPVELNGLQYDGVQCQQLGWIEFIDYPVAKTNNALVRSYSRLSVDTTNGAARNELQARSLFSLAKQMNEQVEALVSSHLEKALIEEDWKAHQCRNSVG
ncbi:hypothetical protein PHPALM_29046 [Phytophthora palmivora]|uniref:M96 mating-specific protein family n=1 Tax=Phytophthora palmivora TaxID=4796 RepID=A0A2P4X8J5_9STRA|nr:hypothetical protein PHPALM_29046 [Phytophthora palmivora]